MIKQNKTQILKLAILASFVMIMILGMIGDVIAPKVIPPTFRPVPRPLPANAIVTYGGGVYNIQIPKLGGGFDNYHSTTDPRPPAIPAPRPLPVDTPWNSEYRSAGYRDSTDYTEYPVPASGPIHVDELENFFDAPPQIPESVDIINPSDFTDPYVDWNILNPDRPIPEVDSLNEIINRAVSLLGDLEFPSCLDTPEDASKPWEKNGNPTFSNPASSLAGWVESYRKKKRESAVVSIWNKELRDLDRQLATEGPYCGGCTPTDYGPRGVPMVPNIDPHEKPFQDRPMTDEEWKLYNLHRNPIDSEPPIPVAPPQRYIPNAPYLPRPQPLPRLVPDN